MKITKSKILLIKLAVLCALTFGLFYAEPTKVGASFCTTCHNNCAAEYTECTHSFWCLSCSPAECLYQRDSCNRQCDIVVCEPPCISPTQSGV